MVDTGSPHVNSLLPVDIDKIPILDPLQLGHLRHIDNLSRQPPNDWSYMSGHHR
jgi:hypothetical protein